MKNLFTIFLFLVGLFQLQGQIEPDIPIGQENCESSYTLTTSPSDCADSNGSVTFNLQAVIFPVTGGILQSGLPNYGLHNSNSISYGGLGAGTYKFKFVDRFGCVVAGTFTITQNSNFRVVSVPQVSCAPNASVGVFVTGGQLPYSSNDPNVTQHDAIGSSDDTKVFYITNLDPGVHTYEFRDNAGCIVTATFTIPDVLVAEVINIGGCAPNAYANIVLSGGTAPYPDGGVFYNPLVTLQGLDSGAQTHTLTDSRGCSVEVTFTIPEKFKLAEIIVRDCPTGQNEWNARIKLTGGLKPYFGRNDRGPDTPLHWIDIRGLDSGSHSFTYTDSNGCEVNVQFTIDPCEIDSEDDIESRSIGNLNITNDSESLAEEIIITPNPTTDFISINLGKEFVGEYQIIDLAGRLIKAGTYAKSVKRISTNELESGTYILRLISSTTEDYHIRKFIKTDSF